MNFMEPAASATVYAVSGFGALICGGEQGFCEGACLVCGEEEVTLFMPENFFFFSAIFDHFQADIVYQISVFTGVKDFDY